MNPHDLATRRRVGYMSQAFSLYGELTRAAEPGAARPAVSRAARADSQRARRSMLERFGLQHERRQPARASCRWACASACRWPWPWCTSPELLILDEPTSGVDPVARDQFWRLLVELSRRDKVTIFISTHFMNEAERCDRMSMMHAGKVLDSDVPGQAGVPSAARRRWKKPLSAICVEASGEPAPTSDAKKIAASADKQALQHKTMLKPSNHQRKALWSWR